MSLSDSGHMQPPAHLLIIPFPAIGHIFPLMKLADQLVREGLTITIMVTPKNLRYIEPLLKLHSEKSIGTLVLPFPGHPEIPDGVENLQELPSLRFTPFLLAACSQLCGPIGEWIKSHSNPPVALMSDVFFSAPAQKLAVELGIKRIGFTPLNAHSLHCCWGGDGPNPENRANMESWGLVFNTFEDLDSKYLGFYREKIERGRVWAVGPLLGIEQGTKNGQRSDENHPVIEWLNSCEGDDSVVYIGFGTQIILNPDQVASLANALDMSGCRFIWAIKIPVTDKSATNDLTVIGMSDGFKERVSQRGIITTEWVPQQRILQHRAVGAYLTHSGWNSVVEGLMGGTLLLLWPMQVDHYDHAKLLADDFKAAVRVCEGLDTVPDSVALAHVLTASTKANEYKDIRVRAVELGRKACDAIEKEGTSFRALKDLVKEVMSLRK